MYRRPKFQEVLLKIRQDMSREADYDVDLFAEMVRSGNFSGGENGYDLSENKENTTKTENGKIQNPKSKI
jgi:hypothetical protein